ncbi:HlyC/CorC family transporter [Simkania negevensis]|uniref:HlyC/CorC family transporter n=1 Tax=Simkania negevensis TaxID=83561 RepID=A0ABS3AR65_9BACT|nr:HlyC/CorC family transporter [Simkania negevensis]
MFFALLIVALVVCTVLSGFFSMSETAFFSIPPSKLKTYRHVKDVRKNLIWRLLSRPRELLVTILMLNILVNILIQNMASSIFGDHKSWLLQVGFPLLITLFFGEILPKSLAYPNNTRISYHVAPIIDRTARFLGPIRSAITSLTTFVMRLMFFFLKKEEPITVEEIRHIVKSSVNQQLLSLAEFELIEGYMKLQSATVKELMQPREDIIYFDIEAPLKKLSHCFVEEEVSKIPVCTKDLDHIIGIAYCEDFFIHKDEITCNDELNQILHKPLYIPETIQAKTLLLEMDEQDESTAIIVDEYGIVTGLITREDLVEVVVGDIIDRRDEKEKFTRSSDDVIITSGKLELGEFEKVFSVVLPTKHNMITIGGWLEELLGDIPKTGQRIVWGDFFFHVLSADPHRVRRVYIRRMTNEEGP